MSNRTYGWIPDTPDHRDFKFSAIRKPVAKLPSKVDLRSLCSPVEDQGSLGSCTANAVVGMMEFLEVKNGAKLFEDFSRLFLYYNTRMIEHTTRYDAGATLRNTIKALSKQGVCSEKMWQYTTSRFSKKPTTNCYADGLNHRATSYYRLSTLDDMRACLADGYPFTFGFSVYDSFETDIVAKTGIVPMPAQNEDLFGGHAVCAVGYSNLDKEFICRNSWSAKWGIGGYFMMPYDYLTNHGLSSDFWTVRKATGLE